MKSRAVKQLIPVLCLMTGLFLYGCGGGGGDPVTGPPFRYDPGLPAQPTGVQASSGDQVVTLSWAPVYVAASYNIYYTSDLAAPLSGWSEISISGGNSYAIWGLTNKVTYYFMVTAVNRDGEGVPSVPVSSTPGPITQADLGGTWYFHTLVSGPGAEWERGTVVIDDIGNTTFTAFLDSAHYNPVDNSTTAQSLPSSAIFTVQGDGTIEMSGASPWASFNGTMGSRKNMWVGTWTYSDGISKALTIFQKQRIDPVKGWPWTTTAYGISPVLPPARTLTIRTWRATVRPASPTTRSTAAAVSNGNTPMPGSGSRPNSGLLRTPPFSPTA